jgi:ethanolamine utilization protein EutN
MHLGRILGNVVATQKYGDLDGLKFLVVQPLDHSLKQSGTPLVAVDTVRAGDGDIVYFVLGREATLALERQFVPVDAAVVGIIDGINTEHDGQHDRESGLKKSMKKDWI